MKNTLSHLIGKTPAGRTAREARAAADAAAEMRAENQRRLAEAQQQAAEARAQIAADLDRILGQMMTLAFQFGRVQGRTESETDTP